MHTYKHTYVHMYIHTYMHTYKLTHIHTYIYTYVHSCIHTHIHTCMQAYIQTRMRACISAFHTYIHTYIHSYIHTIWTIPEFPDSYNFCLLWTFPSHGYEYETVVNYQSQLFLFITDIENETQIVQYHKCYQNHVSRGESSY